MKQLVLALSLLFAAQFSHGQTKLKVLFIGNSYTDVNNLPGVIAGLAAANRDTLEYEKSTPGGATLQMHTQNPNTLALLQRGDWDFVVLQEQSQIPAFTDADVNFSFFPYARMMDSLVHVYNPCAKTVFYITWGRKNGDAFNAPAFPPIGTYEGMDSLLTLRYTRAAEINGAYLSPVGPLWHVLRDQNPHLELYDPDESHPSQIGTFAAACAFYPILFRKNYVRNLYTYTLSTADADLIKNTAQDVVIDSLAYWTRFYPVLRVGFDVDTNRRDSTRFSFLNRSENATTFHWDFGDGTSDSVENPTHTYQKAGTYHVCLTVTKACDTLTYCDSVFVRSDKNTTVKTETSFSALKIFPNPAKEKIHIKGVKGRVDYKVYDLIGRNMMSGTLGLDNRTISLENLPKGIYFLKMSHEKSSQIFKVQKD